MVRVVQCGFWICRCAIVGTCVNSSTDNTLLLGCIYRNVQTKFIMYTQELQLPSGGKRTACFTYTLADYLRSINHRSFKQDPPGPNLLYLGVYVCAYTEQKKKRVSKNENNNIVCSSHYFIHSLFTYTHYPRIYLTDFPCRSPLCQRMFVVLCGRPVFTINNTTGNTSVYVTYTHLASF